MTYRSPTVAWPIVPDTENAYADRAIANQDGKVMDARSLTAKIQRVLNTVPAFTVNVIVKLDGKDPIAT